jgi:ABC-2 type transport system ATP-binding protein
MTSGNDIAVEARGLVKTFAGRRAVDELDLSIPRGSIYGLLGPNGAGKTTTVRMLATLLQPDAGRARVLGHDVTSEARAVREKISLTAQFASLDEDLSASENLVLFARLLGHSWRDARARARDLLEAFGLADAAGRQARALSGGMRRRLDIAASIVVTPELLFLDEPTTGLDPFSRRQVWDLVRDVRDRGTTVLLTTQDLAEADELTDRIAVIDRGRVIAEGRGSEIKAAAGGGELHVRVGDAAKRTEAQAILAAELGVEVHGERDPAGLWARVDADDVGSEAAASALGALARNHIAVADFSFGQASLDAAFIALTGERAQEPDEAGAA